VRSFLKNMLPSSALSVAKPGSELPVRPGAVMPRQCHAGDALADRIHHRGCVALVDQAPRWEGRPEDGLRDQRRA